MTNDPATGQSVPACVNCKHSCIPELGVPPKEWLCMDGRHTHPVTGNPLIITCEAMRSIMLPAACGPLGKWHVRSDQDVYERFKEEHAKRVREAIQRRRKSQEEEKLTASRTPVSKDADRALATSADYTFLRVFGVLAIAGIIIYTLCNHHK